MIEAKFTVEPGDFVLDFGDDAEVIGAGHYLQGILESRQQVERLLQLVRDPVWWLGGGPRRGPEERCWIRMALPCSRSHVTVQTCPEPSGRLQATVRSPPGDRAERRRRRRREEPWPWRTADIPASDQFGGDPVSGSKRDGLYRTLFRTFLGEEFLGSPCGHAA